MKSFFSIFMVFCFTSLLTADDQFPDSNSFQGSDTFKQIKSSNQSFVPVDSNNFSKYGANDQFPGDESFPQMNGVKHRPEPEFPDSESFGNVNENYPKGILPNAPTKMTNLGRPFLTTLGNSTPNSFPGSNSYKGSQSFGSFPKEKQFPTFGPRNVQFPGSNSYPGSENYKPWMSMENDIEVNAGGYTSPYIKQQEKQAEESLRKAQKEEKLKKEKLEKEKLKKEEEEKKEKTLPPNEGIIQKGII